VRISGDPPDAIGRISVAGHAVTVLRGTLSVPSGESAPGAF
jgi:hypothetical protein